MKCEECKFFVNGMSDGTKYHGCKNPLILKEHEVFCRKLSTGWLSINVEHAKIFHGMHCPKE